MKRMGMTIDKTIEFFNGLECHTPQAKDARDVAIETMQKYQKIQEIVNSNPDYIHYTDMDAYKVNSIREVLEDENDDN